ncbi:MAG: hypothetical protein EU518_00805 [Promethearchaeota archaeon]|nr:MAG: hypothetical protein EU518_00805 [Candidatus Lokiarchaeota archaeon]
MDLKEFQEGLISLSFFIIFLSLGILIGSFIARPFFSLEQLEICFILGLFIINLIIAPIFLLEGLRVKKIFKLELVYIIKYTKIWGILVLIYFPKPRFLIFFLFLEMALLGKLISFVLLLFELLLICTVLSQVYNILFVEED